MAHLRELPALNEDSPVSVAEVTKDRSIKPFPDDEWNAWRNARKDDISPRDHRVCVQSVAPIRYGAYIAELGVIPARDGLQGTMAGETLDLQDEDGLRTNVVEYFRTNPAEFMVAVQLCSDLETMPVENAAVAWPEDESPYRPVARLVLPAQDAYSRAMTRNPAELRATLTRCGGSLIKRQPHQAPARGRSPCPMKCPSVSPSTAAPGASTSPRGRACSTCSVCSST
jgi:hypothetical protein